MRISSDTYRGGKSAKKVDLTQLREALRDGRVWCQLGQVFSPDGGAHWYVDTDNEGNRSVMVEVTTMPEGMDLTCRLATKPLWYIPAAGSIVVVAIPSGETDHMPSIIGILDAGDADTDISADRCLLASDVDVVVKSGAVLLGGTDASQQLVKGNAYRAAEGSLNSAWSTFLDVLGAYATAIKGIADPLNVATPVLLTGIAAMQAVISSFESGDYLSPVSKTK